MKKILAIILATVMVFTMVACTAKTETVPDANEATAPSTTDSPTKTPPTTAPSDEVKEIVIAESFNLLDDNVTNIYNCIVKAIDQFNAEHTDVQIRNLYTDAQGSLDKQLADIESLIVQEPDVLIIYAVDSDGTAPAAKAAQEAGIKVIDVMGLKGGYDVRYNAYSEYDAGVMLCEWLDTYFEKNPDAVIEAALLNGSIANTAQIPRLAALKKYAEQHPDKLKILVDYFGDWTTDNAMNVTEDWLQTYPTLNAVFAASDQVALGVCNVVGANGLADSFIITGFDGTESGLSLIESGKMTVTIGMYLDIYAGNLVNLGVDLANGEYVDGTYDGTGVLVAVDAGNLAEFKVAKAAEIG